MIAPVPAVAKQKKNIIQYRQERYHKGPLLNAFHLSHGGRRHEILPYHMTGGLLVCWRCAGMDNCSGHLLLLSEFQGFTDPVYRARRKECADIAFNYRQ